LPFQKPDDETPVKEGSRVQISLSKSNEKDERNRKIGFVMVKAIGKKGKDTEHTWVIRDAEGEEYKAQARCLMISPLKAAVKAAKPGAKPAADLDGERLPPDQLHTPPPTHKIKVEVRISGDWTNVRQHLLKLVRDSNLNTKFKSREGVDVELNDGLKHDYYLRSRATSRAAELLANSRQNWTIEVDHTFECQLLAFSMLNAKSCTKTGGVLRNVDLTATRTHQPTVVRQFLDPIFAVHNDLTALESGNACLNLRLLDKQLNVMKGQVVRGWIKDAYANHEVDSFGRLLEHAFNKSEAVLYDKEDLGLLVSKFERELHNLEENYATALEGALIAGGTGSAADGRAAEERAREVAEAVRDTFAALDLSSPR
jgi:hypothetical protein